MKIMLQLVWSTQPSSVYPGAGLEKNAKYTTSRNNTGQHEQHCDKVKENILYSAKYGEEISEAQRDGKIERQDREI